MYQLTFIFLSYAVYADKSSVGIRDRPTVTCYDCNSQKGDDFCQDPFNSTHPDLQVTVCREACAKWVRRPKNGPVNIIRTCADSLDVKMHWAYVCMKESRPGSGRVCFCDDNLCNAASSPSKSPQRHLQLLTFVAIGLFSFLMMDFCASRDLLFTLNELLTLDNNKRELSILMDKRLHKEKTTTKRQRLLVNDSDDR